MFVNIEEYDIGVSFSGKDREYVKEIVSMLRSYNLRVFYDEDYTFTNLHDELPNIYMNKVNYFSIVFVSQHYKADYTHSANNYTNLERKAIQSAGLKKDDFIIYSRFDDTTIDGHIDTDYTYNLQTMSKEDFVLSIISRINKKILKNTQKKTTAEGYDSSLDWLVGWNGTITPPQKPPKHKLLNSVFVEGNIYKQKLNELLAGGKRTGITGFVGMGGVGKTYTAQKICWELIEKHNWEIVYVVLLEKSPEEALDELISKFGLCFAPNLTLNDKVSVIQKFFDKVKQTYQNLLVVLDNAENFPNLPLLLDAIGDDTAVLITSRTKECQEFIRYDKIQPLDGESAIEYCQKLLFQEEISDKKNDIECLTQLCHNLGGHPLAIRLALANFSTNGLKMSKNNRFCNLQQELKQKGIKSLNNINSLSKTLDEEILHRNIISTFEWTYKELAYKNKNLESHGAYLLLPILSMIGTNKVTLEFCKKGLEYLSKEDKEKDRLDIFNEKSEGETIEIRKDNTQWIKTLKALLENEAELENAISMLYKLSLFDMATIFHTNSSKTLSSYFR